MVIEDNALFKKVVSENYNFYFDKSTGFFARWGATKEENPVCAPSPEILDIEISSGKCKGNCLFCYKSNGSGVSHNMTLDQFKTILSKMPTTLTQIAFGITDIDANPDFFKMMEHAREKGVIPNFTCHGLDDMTPELATKITNLCGAIAVSVYNREKTYNTIAALTNAGARQVNVHYMISEQTYDGAFDILTDIKTDKRLSKLNAIVFLALKQKGRGTSFTPLKDKSKYKKLFDFAREREISIGFDSCSAPVYFKISENTPDEKEALMYAEPCESTLFSAYLNDEGIFYPCSFAEKDEGLDVLNCNNFVDDIWNNEKTKQFRETLLKSTDSCGVCKFKSECRTCPIFDVGVCK